MRSTWPHREFDDGQVLIWTRELAKWDFDMVSAAIDVLTRTEEWFPSVNKVLDQTQAAMRRRYEQRRELAQQRELDVGRYPEDRAQANIASIREMLTGIERPAPKPEAVERRSRPAPPFCPEADHRMCHAGPARVLVDAQGKPVKLKEER